MERRTPYIKIWQDLAIDKSMIFLVGPRQAGKIIISSKGVEEGVMANFHLIATKLLKAISYHLPITYSGACFGLALSTSPSA